MNEIEAVTYAESREAFFAGVLRKAERQLDWAVKHNPDCYVCAEKGEAVAYYQDALAALREQAERSRGCVWCKALSFNPDIGGCQLVFFKSKKHPKGEHAISVSVFDEYGEEQEPVLVQIDNCIRCGRRLEVEHE